MKKIFCLTLVLFFAVMVNANQHTITINGSGPDSGTTVADRKSNEMTIVPNPSSNTIQVRVKMTKAAAGTITVLDNTGKQVLQQDASLQEGNNSIVLNDIMKLNEGTYTVKLLANKTTFSAKLLIWK